MQIWTKATSLYTGDVHLIFIVPNGPRFVSSYALVLYMLGNKVFVGVIIKVAVKCWGTATYVPQLHSLSTPHPFSEAWKYTHVVYFTFMLPCIIIDLFLNNQPDAQIIPILCCYKTLHVSGIFSPRSSILTLLGSGHQKPAWNLAVPNVQQKTPDDGQRRCPKHVEFYNRISASGWLFKKKYTCGICITWPWLLSYTLSVSSYIFRVISCDCCWRNV
jgi:hypothetical protein